MEKNTSWNQHLFESLTVLQLKSFGKMIGLRGCYKLRKSALVTMIVEHLFKKEIIIAFLWQQPLKTIELLKDLIDLEQITIFSHETESYRKLFFYRYLDCVDTAFSFAEEETVDLLLDANVTLNPTFQAVFEQWIKEESESYFSQRKIVDYCIAATNLWGIAPMTEIATIYTKHNCEILSIAKIKETLQQFPYGDVISFSLFDDFIVSNTILKNDSLPYYIAQKQQKPYYMPDKETFLNHTYQYYFEPTVYTQAYSDFLIKEFAAFPLVAKKIVAETISLIQLEHPLHDMIDLLSYNHIVFENKAQLGTLISSLTNLTNNTRLWYNNGHTPIETRLNATTISSKKTGRNSSCPCGSGKKYKHCCGNNQSIHQTTVPLYE